MRALFGSICLTAMLLITRKEFTLLCDRRSLAFLVGAGVCMGLEWMFLYEAFHQVGVGTATLFYFIGPVIVMAISPVLFKETLQPLKLVGFAVVLAAVFLGEAVLPLQALGGVLIIGGPTFCELVGRRHHTYGRYGVVTHEHSRMHRAKRTIVDWAFTPTHY